MRGGELLPKWQWFTGHKQNRPLLEQGAISERPRLKIAGRSISARALAGAEGLAMDLQEESIIPAPRIGNRPERRFPALSGAACPARTADAEGGSPGRLPSPRQCVVG